jgi:hypothetical protein
MAKRPTRRKAHKIQPAVHTLSFELPVTGGGAIDNFTIDLSQCASLVNRRFYRQGINWAVAGMKFLTTEGMQITVQKLPNTWVMSNSWEKGFRSWQKMNDEALSESESVKPKFLDFKIYADSVHHTAGFGANLLPFNFDGAAAKQFATAGEWSASKFIIPDTSLGATGGVQEREVLATGANYPGAGASGLNAVSLIEGYAASRALPSVSDPNTPDDSIDADGVSPENWLQAIFNEGTQQSTDVLDLLSGPLAENNIAPYPFENDGTATDTQYPGGANQLPGLEVHDIESVTSTTVGGQTRIKGGNFPCGLIRVVCAKSSSGPTQPVLQVDLVPGSHRGYLCEPMTDM